MATTPWIYAREEQRQGVESESCREQVPIARTTSVQSSSFSLPYMSPSRPITEVPTDADSRNAVSSHVDPVSLVCRACWKVGSAGITAEDSTEYQAGAAEHRQDHIRVNVVGALQLVRVVVLRLLVIGLRRHVGTVPEWSFRLRPR